MSLWWIFVIFNYKINFEFLARTFSIMRNEFHLLLLDCDDVVAVVASLSRSTFCLLCVIAIVVHKAIIKNQFIYNRYNNWQHIFPCCPLTQTLALHITPPSSSYSFLAVVSEEKKSLWVCMVAFPLFFYFLVFLWHISKPNYPYTRWLSTYSFAPLSLDISVVLYFSFLFHHEPLYDVSFLCLLA